MMKFLKPWVFAVVCGALFNSCTGDHLADPDSLQRSEKSVADMFGRFQPQEQNFTIQAEQGGSFTTSGGSTFTFPPNLFTDWRGNPVTGTVNLSVLEIDKRSKMVLYGATTFTRNGDPLASGGMFHIKAMQNGLDLYVANSVHYSINVPSNDLQNDMQAFRADTAGVESPSRWFTDTSSIVFIDSLEKYYTLNGKHFNWINIDRFSDGPFTTINASLGGSHIPQQAYVFLVFKEDRTALDLTNNGQFKYSAAKIPLGREATLVAIGLNNSRKIIAAFRPLKTAQNMDIALNLKEITDVQLRAYLDELDR